MSKKVELDLTFSKANLSVFNAKGCKWFLVQNSMYFWLLDVSQVPIQCKSMVVVHYF